MIVALTVVTAGLASAQVAVTLPDNSQSTMLTANVSEQAQVTVPTGVTFNVTNVQAATVAFATSVAIDHIVLATAAKTLKISVLANVAAFTPSVAGSATWAATNVSWNASTLAPAGAGTAGILALTAVPVGSCAADASVCNISNLVFTLA